MSTQASITRKQARKLALEAALAEEPTRSLLENRDVRVVSTGRGLTGTQIRIKLKASEERERGSPETA